MNAKQHFALTNIGRFFASGILAVTLLLAILVQPLLADDQVPFRGRFSVMADSTFVPPFFLNSTVTGGGQAQHMGKSSLLGIDIEINLVTQEVKGFYAMTAANGDQPVVYTEQSGTYLDEFTVLFEGNWTVVSGTGRFAGATGGGGMSGWLVFTNHEDDPGIGENEFKGTISSPGSVKQ